ncbi:hydrogenase formation protein HypD [Celerinatantimonas yamalensis]|uniref:Hydrogenase maturation factor n=1 Tax=Celerinatantimonas yamalensis TaxID=559956 RepID=A0ABW9GB33_9GAMM
MRWIDDYRGASEVTALLAQISAKMAHLTQYNAQQPLRIMEVCGGHTHAIFRFGLDKLLPDNIEFIHGPGCPVCVLPMGRIDSCLDIAHRDDVIFLTFGDAMRVPGGHGSLLDARRKGADIRMIYSPLDAIKIAQDNLTKQVVFFALGFETTMPASAITFIRAKEMGLSNLFGFCQHITIIPTLNALLSDPNQKIDALLGPGHVAMIIGANAFTPLCQLYQRPLVVSGFEPVDMLHSILMLVQQIQDQRAVMENQYARVVRADGNPQAQAAIKTVFCLKAHSQWRGLGDIADSGMQFTPEFASFDAERYFQPIQYDSHEQPQACCAQVLTGRCKPQQCPLFARQCTPQHPTGALMVSSEGACAAYYQYNQECICQTM